jgi:maltose alpha-D-glucosyltransferase/alpha-amylase
MLDNDPLWYKDAIIYELHVRAFQDSDADGLGDFRGLTQRLDYLQDLGVTAIWVLPFYPSPLKDDGYDIADYGSINPDYGTLRDFRNLLKEAHARGLRVITELVINHTSDQHPWFQRARRAPAGSAERNFYVWSDSPDRFQEARVIFQDFETSNWAWDPVAKAYYWHRFYGHQPDLNFDNPEVWKAIFPVLDFWMEMGVDGMRLDAIPYLYEREGTNCENLPETHEFLRALRRHMDEKFTGKMFVAEANQWPEDAVAYFGRGDECHMEFHFPVMPRLFMAIHMEDRFPIIDIMEQTPPIPDNCQWCMFLRNHDELTLEMVTDEERDYMYKAYATDPRARINLGIRRRLAPLLGNNRRRIELMMALLFSLPGTPVLYYGDEIGMGDNIFLGDRNGVRTPMQWSADRNAGFSRANPQKLYLPVIIDPEYHYESINVEAQQNNPHSLLWWMKRLIGLRRQFKAFGRGSLQFLHPENRKILAFLRRYQEETILVVANLSRFVQYVELDLAEFKGSVPVELFGRNPFPPVGKVPYLLTLAPHSFYWFSLEPQAAPGQLDRMAGVGGLLRLGLGTSSWETLFQTSNRLGMERALTPFIQQRRWFGAKARTLKTASLREALPVRFADTIAYVTLVHVEFNDGAPETYVVPLTYAGPDRATQVLNDTPHAVVARVQLEAEEGVLYDALLDSRFCNMILESIRASAPFEGSLDQAALVATGFPALQEVLRTADTPLTPSISKAEQSNTSIMYGNQLMLKVYRRVDEGINPELELGRYLTEVRPYPHTAPVLGAIELRRRKAEPMVLAVLQKLVPNEGDAWQYTLDELGSYFERVVTTNGQHRSRLVTSETAVLELLHAELSATARDMIGTYLGNIDLLGQRTAELHILLAAETEDQAFVPQQFGKLYQRSVYQSMRNLVGKSFQLLRQRLGSLPAKSEETARRLLNRESEVLRQFHSVMDRKLTGLRTRIHGDYHLGQVLWTGKDFVIIDFEGEPDRSMSDRRRKRSPLNDLAGMIRSFHYAAFSSLYGWSTGRGRTPGVIRPEDVAGAEIWAQFWFQWVSVAFLKAYLRKAEGQAYLPQTEEEFRLLLRCYILEKAIYELGYELNHRPDWAQIPLLGITHLLEPTQLAMVE